MVALVPDWIDLGGAPEITIDEILGAWIVGPNTAMIAFGRFHPIGDGTCERVLSAVGRFDLSYLPRMQAIVAKALALTPHLIEDGGATLVPHTAN